MTTRISSGAYKDQEAVILDTDAVRAVLLPGCGAKLASLVHKGLDVETLWQNPSGAYTCSAYGDPYGNGEFSGIDETFPATNRCFYENDPWAGVEIPDHGEVWSRPWEHSREADAVRLWIHGVRFPYRLEKEVSLNGSRLINRYRAANLSTFRMDFIWAAHPLFNAVEGMLFVVPPGMNRVINAVPGPALETYGQRYSFPTARVATGTEVRLDRVPKRNTTGYQRYWFDGPVTEGWCLLYDPSRRLAIGLAFPREKVPYLGMWLNEGGFGGQYNIAPEPGTGAMDRIDFSRTWGMSSTLQPGETREWQLVVSIAEGELPRGMEPDGRFVF
jgi:galactose mutarotase-like enzyme